MTVKEFYDEVGGGYEEMAAKFASDATITAFLKIFVRDTSFENLSRSLEEGNVEEAFQAAHMLKGVILNLNLAGLIGPVGEVTEALRAKKLELGKELFPKLKEAYDATREALDKLMA